MKRGSKSLLVGVHQFLWHPLTVAYAWRRLYGRWPNWWEAVGIFCHDLGYWGCPDMDGEKGRYHPVIGARIAASLVRNLACIGWILRSPVRVAFDGPYGVMASRNCARRAEQVFDFCLGHSKHYAALSGCGISPLYIADKASVLFDPKWFYLLRGFLSGETIEYRDNSPLSCCKVSEWFDYYRRTIQNRVIQQFPEKFILSYIYDRN